MSRQDFTAKPPRDERVFNPSVGEVWKERDSDGELLLYEAWEPNGFRGIGYNKDWTLNFNQLPKWWHECYVYVKTIDKDKVAEIVKDNKGRGWA
jgi:hypothetical protein